MADTNNQSDGSKVLELDAIGPDTLVPDISGVGSALAASANQAFSGLNKQILDTTQAWNKLFASSIAGELKKMAETHKALAKSLEINFRFDFPQLYLPSTLTRQPVRVAPIASDGLLEVSIDQYGQFTLDGSKLIRANAKSSRHGQLLSMLEDNKGELVSEKQIKKHLNVTNPKQVMKDLKKDLRLLGYKLQYERYMRQGIVYKGVLKRQ